MSLCRLFGLIRPVSFSVYNVLPYNKYNYSIRLGISVKRIEAAHSSAAGLQEVVCGAVAAPSVHSHAHAFVPVRTRARLFKRFYLISLVFMSWMFSKTSLDYTSPIRQSNTRCICTCVPLP